MTYTREILYNLHGSLLIDHQHGLYPGNSIDIHGFLYTDRSPTWPVVRISLRQAYLRQANLTPCRAGLLLKGLLNWEIRPVKIGPFDLQG